jgi:HEAT repeat protein
MEEEAFTPLEPLDELVPHTLTVDVEAMLSQLEHPETSLRIQAARIFCDVEEPRSVLHLLRLLEDPCPLVRVSASYALGRNGGGVEVLIQALQEDWNGYVRKGLVWALGNARDGRGVPILMRTLQKDITAVRLWAASALGQLAPVASISDLPSLIQTLITALQTDPVAAVRCNCAWSLGLLKGIPKITKSSQIQILKALKASAQEDPDLGVQDDARSALEKWGVTELYQME